MKRKKRSLVGLIGVWVVLTLTLTLSLTLLAFQGHAAIPQKINYQGYLTNASGVPINGTLQMTFAIYDVPSGGATLWTETQTVSVSHGVYSVNLGDGTPLGLTFNAPYYLGVQVGTDLEMMPRQALTSMPYAFRAAQVENVSTQNQIISTVATGTAPLQVSSTTVVPNLNADMIDSRHAAEFVLKTGDTMTGQLAIDVSGTEGAAKFRVMNPSNSSPALYAYTTGQGYAGYFEGSANVTADFRVGRAMDIGGRSRLRGAPGASFNSAGFWLNNSIQDRAFFGLQDDTHVGLWGNSGAGWAFLMDTKTGDITATGKIKSTTSNGSGAGEFKIMNPSNTGIALYAETNGSGQAIRGLSTGNGNAGHLNILNPASSASALYVGTNGTGPAIEAAASEGSALTAINNGGSSTLYALASGTGRAGSFSINNPSNSNYALYAETNGTGYAGYFNGKVRVVGDLMATSFTGSGSGLTDVIPAAHFHSSADITSGVLPITHGGTGSSSQNFVDLTTNQTVYGQKTFNGAMQAYQYAATGNAGNFSIIDTTNLFQVIRAKTFGLGQAGWFEIANTSNTLPAIYAQTNATATSAAVYGVSTGNGIAGHFVISNTGNGSPALYAVTNGAGPAGQFGGNVSVSGGVTAASFSGDGSSLSNVRSPSRFSGRINNLSSSGTEYGAANGVANASLAEKEVVVLNSNSSCTAQNLSIKVEDTIGSATFTLVADGVDTSMSCFISGGSTCTSTGTAVIGAGSELSVKVVSTTSTARSVLFGWECR